MRLLPFPVLLLFAAALPAEEAGIRSIALSDPARPCVLRIRAVDGQITVRGGTGREVRLESQRPRHGAELQVTEVRNTVTVTVPPTHRAGLTVQVPEATSVEISLVNGARLRVERVRGSHDLTVTNGGISLFDVEGTVTASVTNGNLEAICPRLAPDTTLALATLNGSVSLTLPAQARATLDFRVGNFGTIASELGITQDPDQHSGFRTGHTLKGTLGGGGARISARTHNGGVQVKKLP